MELNEKLNEAKEIVEALSKSSDEDIKRKLEVGTAYIAGYEAGKKSVGDSDGNMDS